MIGGVLEGILEFIVEVIFRLIVEIVGFYTGEIILSFITLGTKKVCWDIYEDTSVSKWTIMTELSTVVGLAFWIFAIGYLARFLAS